MDWYVEVLKKYAVFRGRARRAEYWMFLLISLLVTLVLSAVEWIASDLRFLGALYGLAVLLPSLAVGVRRLHDTDRSGWWMLITLVPFIGVIVLLVFMLLDSQPGANRFGPNPKAEVT